MILRPELAAGMANLPFKLSVLRKRDRLCGCVGWAIAIAGEPGSHI
jgi:hypothetical protein